MIADLEIGQGTFAVAGTLAGLVAAILAVIYAKRKRGDKDDV